MKSLLKLATVAVVAVSVNACSKSDSKKPEQAQVFDQNSIPKIVLSPEAKVKTVDSKDEGYYQEVKISIPNGEGSTQFKYTAVLLKEQTEATDFVNMKFKGVEDGTAAVSTFGTSGKAIVVVQWPSIDATEGKAFIFLKEDNGSYSYQFDSEINSSFTKDELVERFITSSADMGLTVDEWLMTNSGKKEVEEILAQKGQTEEKTPSATPFTGPQ